MNVLTTIIFLCVITLLLQQHSTVVSSSSSVRRRIDELLESNKIEEAIKFATSITCDAIQCVESMVHLGVQLHERKDYKNAEVVYQHALSFLGDSRGQQIELVLLNNLGRIQVELGIFNEAIRTLTRVVQEHNDKIVVQDWLRVLLANTWNNIGLAHHRKGSCCEKQALEAFEIAFSFQTDLNKNELLFNMGVSLKNLGEYERAADMYLRAIELNDESFVMPVINLAALYHEHMMLPEAIEKYLKVIQLSAPSSSLRLMALANVGAAYTEIGEAEKAIATYRQLVLEHNPGDDYDIQARVQISVARRTICDWEDFDQDVAWIAKSVEERQLALGKRPFLLPFDSLLLPLDPKFRLRLAQIYASHFHSRTPLPHDWSKSNVLIVGYLSYDFNDHPTAHLCEELFSIHKRHGTVESHTLSYGKDDGSAFRSRIKQAGHAFHDIAALPHEESIQLIRDLGVEVLLDMQGFTRGGRVELTLSRPSPIIVNYLVFAGTSGASFTDYFVGDRYVSPLAEFASLFQEKLIIMPNCYQVNSYEAHSSLTDAVDLSVSEYQLRDASFVFVNFNKNDKLEPLSFRVWMSVLKRVPGSVLWLLEPSRRHSPVEMKRAIVKQAQASGVHPGRIKFAQRVDKVAHIARHKLAHLFLDTLVYGAHSTATDALRGGLPVLTMLGESFANRVAASLLYSVDMPYLISHSAKDFIETAVRIATSPSLYKGIRRQLSKNLVNGGQLFDTESYTGHLEEAFRAAVHLKQFHADSVHHIVVLES